MSPHKEEIVHNVENQNNDKFTSSLKSKNLAPLWTVMEAMVPPRPQPEATTEIWRYKECRDLLLQAGELIDAEEAERRVLMLVNPTMKAPFTTDTIYAGLQLILPGETAPAHRHTATAMRFIIEGDKGFTAVEGKKIMMRRGDVILTPSWHWHDHGHDGEGPMIWLDGLDLPLYQHLPENFAEMYPEKRYPSELSNDDEELRVGWEVAQKNLDEQIGRHATFHYEVGPEGAKRPLSRTIGGQAERIDQGGPSSAIRESCSFVYHCVEGSGRTTLQLANGSTSEIKWTHGDTFAVPGWSGRVHESYAERSYLFAVNDRPLLENLGMYKKD